MMTRTAPPISIIVPTFNEAAQFIEMSLGSLRTQTWSDFECLVVDESPDPARAEFVQKECAKDSRFHYLHPPARIGLAASLNLALAQAKGEFIARFDADDVCLPERIERQVTFLRDHPEIGIVGSALEVMDDEGHSIAQRGYPLSHEKIARKMMITNAMAHPTVMFRRSVFEGNGIYDPSFRFSEDLELWLRWLNAGVKFANLADRLVKYRQLSTTRTMSNWESNLRARKRHFTNQYLLLRTLGILSIAVWSRIPPDTQARLYRLLIFKPSPSAGKT